MNVSVVSKTEYMILATGLKSFSVAHETKKPIFFLGVKLPGSSAIPPHCAADSVCAQ